MLCDFCRHVGVGAGTCGTWGPTWLEGVGSGHGILPVASCCSRCPQQNGVGAGQLGMLVLQYLGGLGRVALWARTPQLLLQAGLPDVNAEFIVDLVVHD